MIFVWKKKTGNEEVLLFTVPVGVPFLGMYEHEPIIVDLFLPVVSCRY